jgi:iron complex outermembrane receptor protein
MRKISLFCATTALVMPAFAFAQSTGSVDFEDTEEEAIVVTGTRVQEVGGVQAPDTSKARAALTQELISRQNPGQTILDTINVIPGVSFQNNDAYGSSGGTLTIRGFTSDRVSLTVDGIPTNDSGNYAIFSGQQIDPELIGEVNVSLGSTDIDSPTASAAGGTVNYRSIIPRRELGAMVSASIGEFDFHRVFGLIETGELTSLGTRAYLSASTSRNDNPFNNYGKVKKNQYNAKVYQPVGSGGDFISVAGTFNQLRNNFFGSLPLRQDANRVVGPQAANRFPRNNDEREYLINFPCQVDTPQAGVADTPIASPIVTGSSCGTEFDRRFNPADTANLRGSSRFSFGQFTLTVDPSYQYTKANGGGTVTAQEGLRDINPTGGVASTTECRTDPVAGRANRTCVAGYLGGSPFFGRDVNGDGDVLDTVTVVAPSQTQTHRYGLITGVRYDFNDEHTVRVAYTFDRARHRQTGEVGLVDLGGTPFNVFPVDAPQADVTGSILQKRNRLSYAILHQVAGQYRGEFLEGALVVDAGLRAPFFKRELNNFCFTTSASGNVECFNSNDAAATQFGTLNPTRQGPQRRTFKYDKLLPSIGLTYDLTPRFTVFGNYAKGLSVPSTDNLYSSFFFAADTPQAQPTPETTDNFDLGLRYRSSKVQAQLAGFYNKYKNRQAQAFDPELNESVFRNLGSVEKYGVDGYVSYTPIPQLELYAFGSYLKSEIQEDVLAGECNAAQIAEQIGGCTTLGAPFFAPTAGKRESGSPKYTFGGSARGLFGPFQIGVTAKRTGPRFIYDTNLPIFGRITNAGVTTTQEIFGAAAPAYWLVNADARFSLEQVGLARTYVQVNVYNLFDQFYVGGFGGGLFQNNGLSATPTATTFGNPPFVQIGAPRTVSATLVVGF